MLEGLNNQFGPAELYAYETVWGGDGKFLYMRTKGVRSSDAAEVPNRLLRPWQEAHAKQGSLGLDELAQISQLSEDQMDNLKLNSIHLRLGERVRVGEALRLYGMLTPRQREAARGNGISISELTVTQREALDGLQQSRGAPRVNVGIYMDSRRVDKPIEVPEEQAVSLLIRGLDQGHYVYQPEGSLSPVDVVNAGSLGEALTKIHKRHPGAKQGDVKLGSPVKPDLVLKSRTPTGATMESSFPLM